MHNDIAYRAAWNRGFEQRFAELGMVKEAVPGTQLTKALASSGSSLRKFIPGVTVGEGGVTTFANNFGKFEGPMSGVTMPAAQRQLMMNEPGVSEASISAMQKNRNDMAAYLRQRRGSKLALDQLYDMAGNGGKIPQMAAGSFGATPANYLSTHLWNNRTPWQRAGVVGGGLHLLGTHNQARGAQKAYDDFSEAHPILSTFARLGGVQRPDYLSTFAGRALNPTNALGIL